MKAKKFLAGILSVATVLSAMAMPAFAEETEVPTIKITRPTENEIAELIATSVNDMPYYSGKDGLYDTVYKKVKAKYDGSAADVTNAILIEPVKEENINSKEYSGWSFDTEISSKEDMSVFILIYKKDSYGTLSMRGMTVNLDSTNNHTSRVFDKFYDKYAYTRAYHFFNDGDYDYNCFFIPVTDEMCNAIYEVLGSGTDYETFKTNLKKDNGISYINENTDISLNSYVYKTTGYYEETGDKFAVKNGSIDFKKTAKLSDGRVYSNFNDALAAAEDGDTVSASKDGESLDEAVANAGFEVEEGNSNKIDVVAVKGDEMSNKTVTFGYTIGYNGNTYDAGAEFSTGNVESEGTVTFGVLLYNIPDGATVSTPNVTIQ